ncbi:MAG TPA: TraB/GumN family protein [Gallionellaceae bacterium]|nr:TraB/GumN family protein [Gallionellaceae bacterium]
MLKTICLALLLLLLAVALPACAAETACPPALAQPTPEMIQAGMRNAHDHGFLWRISKDGRTSYLYGTIHVAKFEWMFPGPNVSRALQATDTVALELDLLDADIQGRMARGVATLQGEPLPEPLLKRMRQQAEAVCVPYESIANFSPEMQVTTVTMMVGRRAGLEAGYAIDGVLAGIGHAAKKNMVSLETPEMQLHLLQMQNQQETISFVQDSLDELETGRSLRMLKRIAQVWADADYAEMTRFNDWCECLNTEMEREMMKRALDERNTALAEHIDALHQSGKRVFAAVGSLHMFGALGLPGLLEKRGYRIEQISLK